jgi:hypothetical protein
MTLGYITWDIKLVLTICFFLCYSVIQLSKTDRNNIPIDSSITRSKLLSGKHNKKLQILSRFVPPKFDIIFFQILLLWAQENI